MADYTAQRALANRLIGEKGTTFVFSKTESAADPATPWEGGGAADPVNATLAGVRVEPSSAIRLGIGTVKESLVARATHILIVAPGDGTADPKDYDKVTVGGELCGITFTETLDPDGSGGIVYFVGCER